VTQGLLRANPRCLLTELNDGTGVLLHLDTKFYFTLNASAVAAWKALELTPRSASELARGLAEEFEVDRDQALLDLSALIDRLVAEGLLVAESPDRGLG
jgi:hypothetical protein